MLTASLPPALSLALLPACPPGDLVAMIPRQASGWFGSHTCLTPGDPGTPHGDLPHLYQQVTPWLPCVLSSGLSFSGAQGKPRRSPGTRCRVPTGAHPAATSSSGSLCSAPLRPGASARGRESSTRSATIAVVSVANGSQTTARHGDSEHLYRSQPAIQPTWP